MSVSRRRDSRRLFGRFVLVEARGRGSDDQKRGVGFHRFLVSTLGKASVVPPPTQSLESRRGRFDYSGQPPEPVTATSLATPRAEEAPPVTPRPVEAPPATPPALPVTPALLAPPLPPTATAEADAPRLMGDSPFDPPPEPGPMPEPFPLLTPPEPRANARPVPIADSPGAWADARPRAVADSPGARADTGSVARFASAFTATTAYSTTGPGSCDASGSEAITRGLSVAAAWHRGRAIVGRVAARRREDECGGEGNPGFQGNLALQGHLQRARAELLFVQLEGGRESRASRIAPSRPFAAVLGAPSGYADCSCCRQFTRRRRTHASPCRRRP